MTIDDTLWNMADAAAADAEKFFRNTGGLGAVSLFYRETTADADGAVFMVSADNPPPLGSFNAGVPPVRGNLSRQQIARLWADALRRLPILPLERGAAGPAARQCVNCARRLRLLGIIGGPSSGAWIAAGKSGASHFRFGNNPLYTCGKAWARGNGV